MSWNLWFGLLNVYEGWLYFISQGLDELTITISLVVSLGITKYFLLTAINRPYNIFIFKTKSVNSFYLSLNSIPSLYSFKCIYIKIICLFLFLELINNDIWLIY